MSKWELIKLWFNIRKFRDALREEMKMGYDPKVGAAKALRDFAITCLAIAATAILAFFSVPANLAPYVGLLPDHLEKAFIAIISPMIVFAYNWMKERNR